MSKDEKEPTALVPMEAGAGVQSPGSSMRGVVRIRMDIDLDAHTAMLHVEAGAVQIEIAIDDTRKPVPLDPETKTLMEGIAAGLIAFGARPQSLQRRTSQYALWALAQHVKFGRTYDGPRVAIGSVSLPQALPPREAGRPSIVSLAVVPR